VTITRETCGGIQPEKYEENVDVSSEDPIRQEVTVVAGVGKIRHGDRHLYSLKAQNNGRLGDRSRVKMTGKLEFSSVKICFRYAYTNSETNY
jgi:hypothetical protein